jgi:hypothetical protein
MPTPRIVSIRAAQIRNIPVSEDIIASSIRGDSRRCMLRNAIALAVPDAKRIEVDLQHIRFTLPDGYRRKYPTPAGAAYNLASFEAGDSIEPFTFSLRGGVVFDSTQGESKPGTPKAVRAWAEANGLLTPEQATAQKGRGLQLPDDIKTAYTEATGYRVLAQATGRQRHMTRPARQNIRGDRFYGLRLANGFQPGGAVKDDDA